MATANQESGYLTPENTRVFYDAPNDVVRITIADADFGPEGLSTVLKKESKADLAARAALKAQGINAHPVQLDFDALPSRSQRVEVPILADDLRWQVGTGIDGPVLHSFAHPDAAHLLISGIAGAGKTPLVGSMVEQLLEQECKLWIIESRSQKNIFDRLTLYPFLGNSQVTKFVGDSYDDPHFMKNATDLLRSGVAEMHRRFELLRSSEFKHIAKLRAALRADGVSTEDISPLVIVIEETATIFADQLEVENRQLSKDAATAAIELARKARSADIHLVLVCGYPVNACLPSAIRQSCARIGMRSVNSVASRVMIEQDGLEKIRHKGVGALLVDAEPVPFKALRSNKLER